MTTSVVRRWRRSDATHGVTLVELLVTIMIIGILSSSVLFAMSVAQESARKARTQALIATLHSLLIERWETYLTKRYSFEYFNVEYQAADRKKVAEMRLKVARQFQVMDFPDQWDDILYVAHSAYDDAIRAESVGALHNRYYWHAGAAQSGYRDTNQGAECLYLIIGSIKSEAGNWKKTDESFIGDTDNDSAPEFLDGWGRPVEFLRWPSGFPSDMQLGQPAPDSPSPPAARVVDSYGVREAAVKDHDPFDPFRSDTWAYRLVPLIFSAGPDGIYDIAKPRLKYGNSTDMDNRWNPYYLFEYEYEVNGSVVKKYKRMGEPLDLNDDGVENWHDNIHNHLISTR